MKASASYPFAESVRQAAIRTTKSFHALPISGSGSLDGSEFRNIFELILGPTFDAEISVGPPFVCSLSNQKGPLIEAEKLAAKTFGADRSFFTTCGTSLSNEIVIRALLEKPGIRVLADRGLHQSVHLALRDTSATVTYLKEICISGEHKLYAFDIDDLKAALTGAEKQEKPFKVLILNGQSYEGLVYKIDSVAEIVSRYAPSLQAVFVDEAWGCANYFSKELRNHTAMAAANCATANEVTYISSQSAHKSLSALRQASFIHIKGSSNLAKRIFNARYRFHTTSPNLRITASLDLARAQMDQEGTKFLERSVELANRLREDLSALEAIKGLSVENIDLSGRPSDYITLDPTKVMVRINNNRLDGNTLRQWLFKKHGIYTSRCGISFLLFNCHIGTQEHDIKTLVAALQSLRIGKIIPNGDDTNPAQTSGDYLNYNGEKIDGFLIPYPPGVPVVMDGEHIDASAVERIRHASLSGSSIIKV